MSGLKRRIEDAEFLWKEGRYESAFLLVLVSIASVSKLRYPNSTDGEAFKSLVKDFRTTSISIEYRGELLTIESVFYKWIRCQLIHEGELPSDIVFQNDLDKESMSLRAGGAPEFVLKLGTGWFFHFLNSVKAAEEYNSQL